jgi:hypothetical protein
MLEFSEGIIHSYLRIESPWNDFFFWWEGVRLHLQKEVYIIKPFSCVMWLAKLLSLAKRQWLMPVILATQEAEIRRIAV